MRWTHGVGSSLTQIFYLYNFPETLTNNSIAGFTTTVSIIPPDYTSTATLSRALLSDDNITLQCLMNVMNLGTKGLHSKLTMVIQYSEASQFLTVLFQ